MRAVTGRKTTGGHGERIAAEYLRLRGYEIIRRNYHGGHKEIDLIASRNGCLAFIEVKTRRGNRFGEAVQGFSRGQLRNIRQAARRFFADLEGGTRYQEARFDLIAIDLDRAGEGMVLTHLKGIA